MTDLLPKAGLRAVIYARYSTDHQSAASVTDQIRLCERLCAEKGWTIAGIYSDDAQSGFNHLRSDYQRMLSFVEAGSCDVIVAESYERLIRDGEHSARLYKRMTYLGVPIVTSKGSRITEIDVGLSSLVSGMTRKLIADKTHRGLEGRVIAGKSAGGISYGYRLDRQLRPDGTFTTGDRVIDPDEAAIIRRIFGEYDQGLSARTIAMGLNRDAIPAPRAGGKGTGTWSFSTISGNWKRGTGILNNEIYIGRLVWNRQRFVKDPDTNKRQARLNPPEDWVIHDVPDLRIIDDSLWDRVKQRQGAIRDEIVTAREASPHTGAPHTERGKRPSYLFSGLLSCGCCGANYIMISATRYGCAAARNKGTCANRKTIARKDIEARSLAGLRHKLMHPDLVRAFITEYQRALREADTQDAMARKTHMRRLDAVCKEIDNMVDAIAKGMFHDSMKARMDRLEAERQDLETRISALPAPAPVVLHPGVADIYARKVGDLAAALDQDGTRTEAAEVLRGLIQQITLRPDADAPNGHVIEIYGELGAILALCDTDAKARTGGAGIGQVTLVAGTGFEPVTFRL